MSEEEKYPSHPHQRNIEIGVLCQEHFEVEQQKKEMPRDAASDFRDPPAL